MSDAQVKGLLAAGLALQALAVALAFQAPWAVPAAAAVVAIGAVALSRRTWPFALGVVACVAAQAVTRAPSAVWLVRVVFGLEALAQLAPLVFLATFRMKRLW